MIGNLLKHMLTRGLSMKRWNNYPRIEDVSLLDNVWYTIHIALFLAHLEEKNGTKIDREFLMKRIIFNSFKSLIISDINSGTKDYILRNDKNIFLAIENKAVEYILSLEAPEYFKIDMRETLYNTSNTVELHIISASKRFAWYKECQVNEKVFTDMYEVPLKQIQKWFEEDIKNLKSMGELLKNDNFMKYLTHIRRLSHCTRWNQQKRIYPISVMSHLVVITFLTYIIVMIENNHGKNYNMLDMLLRSIYHDIPEAITGDIITPTKKAVPWFVELLEKVEIDMMNDYLFYYIGDDYKNEVYNFMLHPFDGKNWEIVKYADIMSSLLEAKVEVNYGSSNFLEIYRFIKKKVNTFDSVSIDYLLKHGLDSFDEKGNDDIHLEKF